MAWEVVPSGRDSGKGRRGKEKEIRKRREKGGKGRMMNRVGGCVMGLRYNRRPLTLIYALM